MPTLFFRNHQNISKLHCFVSGDEQGVILCDLLYCNHSGNTSSIYLTADWWSPNSCYDLVTLSCLMSINNSVPEEQEEIMCVCAMMHFYKNVL